jgi:hypothetical protein
MSVMQQNRKNPILLGQDNNALTWLLIINLVLFAIIAFVKVIYYLEYDTPMERIQNFHLQITDWVSFTCKSKYALSKTMDCCYIYVCS